MKFKKGDKIFYLKGSRWGHVLIVYGEVVKEYIKRIKIKAYLTTGEREIIIKKDICFKLKD